MNPEIPLILLSGMGADERLFHYQKAAFPNLIVPPWIEPDPHESVSSYAQRLARLVDPGVPCFVGGASFGGVVALEMAHHLPALACFLIGSIRSPDQLPWHMRICRPLCLLGPARLGSMVALLLRFFKPSMPRKTSRQLQRLTRPEAAFLRWAALAVLAWKLTRHGHIPIYQIHGQNDRTLPVHLTVPDVVVHGGDHMLPFTFPKQVNDFLRDRIENFAVPE